MTIVYFRIVSLYQTHLSKSAHMHVTTVYCEYHAGALNKLREAFMNVETAKQVIEGHDRRQSGNQWYCHYSLIHCIHYI